LEIDCRDHADGRDYKSVARSLSPRPGFHFRIVRWT